MNRFSYFSLGLFVFAFVVLRLGFAYHAVTAGYAPMLALVVIAAIYLPFRLGLAACVGAYLLSDVLINSVVYNVSAMAALNASSVFNAILFAGMFVLASLLRRPKFPVAAGLTVFGVVAFYLVANTGAWISSPAYAKNIAGWWQSQTVGLPGFPPSYYFLRNGLIGNLAFLALAWPFFASLPFLRSRAVNVAAHERA